MTMTSTYEGKSIKGTIFLMMLAFAAFASVDAKADSSCTVSYSDGHVTPDCPNGQIARYDISPKCIEQNTNTADSCINVMPVTNVSRIPEDVCYRNEGWSKKRNHNGMDYAATMGTAVTAAMDGTIIRYSFGVSEPARGVCQSSGGGYGNVVYIQHEGCDGTYTTRYGHLTNKTVDGLKNGSKVKKGDVIGYVGGTGGACGRPHLHFELRGPGDTLINPLCDQIQGICKCQSPVPSSDLSSCKDAEFAASSSSSVDATAGVTAISIAKSSGSDTPLKGSNSCASFEEVRNSYREWGCIFCKPFEIIFNTASVMAKQSFDALSEAVIVVVVVAFAIWLALVTLRFVSTMEIREPRIFVKTLLNQAFRVLIVVILLNSELSYILSMTLDPVFSTGLQIAQLAGKISNTCTLDANLSIVSDERGGLSSAMGTGILCTIKAIQDQIGDILALGEVCWCLAWSSENAVMLVFPHLGYMLTGILYYVGGVALLFIYPFLLVDCLLKLAIAVALLPAALGAFAFKATSQYLQKVWNVFLNAVLSFIFLSLIIFIIASIAADTLSEILTAEVGILLRFFWWMVEVVKVVAVCFLGWAVLGEMKKFSDAFAQTLKLNNIGSQTGSTALEFGAKRPGLFVGKAAVKGAVVGGTAVGRVAHEGITRMSINRWKGAAEGNTVVNPFNPFSSINHGIQKARDANGNVLKDKDGNEMYDTSSILQRIRGKKEYRTFTTDASGNTKMTVTTESRSGKKTVRETDSYATTIKKYDKNGQEVKSQQKINASMLKYSLNKDGTYNHQVINDFMQNSLMSEKDKQIMLVSMIMKERLNTEAAQELTDACKSRQVEKRQDENGNETWTITQENFNGSKTTFTLTFGAGNRVMSEYRTIAANGKGISLATDGIVQRKTYIETKTNKAGEKVVVTESRYSFSKYYSNIAGRPLYSTGEFAENIPADQILFSQSDMKAFAKQVGKEGNKAYSFEEFK